MHIKVLLKYLITSNPAKPHLILYFFKGKGKFCKHQVSFIAVDFKKSLSIMTICRISQWSAPCWTWPAWAWRGSTPLCTRSSPAQCAPSHKQGQVTSKTLFFCITGRFLFCRRVVAVAWFLSFFLALPRNWIQVSHSAFNNQFETLTGRLKD